MARSRKHISNTQQTKPTAVFGTKEYENEFYSQYMQYSQKYTDNDCKKYFLSYVATLNTNIEDYSILLPKQYHPYGIYAKMVIDGILLPETEKQSLDKFLVEVLGISKQKKIKREQSRQEKNNKEQSKISLLLADIEIYLDNQLDIIRTNKKPIPNTDNILRKYPISANSYIQLVSYISENLTRRIKELTMVKSKKDDQLIEGYNFLTPKQVSIYLDFVKSLKEHIISNRITTPRKQRELKHKTPEMLIKNLHIQDRHDELNLISRPKTNIIGSNLVFVYNTKTRCFIRYESANGISVKGSTLLNIDETLSIKKKIRKPEVVFASINPTNRTFMERVWKSIKTKPSPVKARINRNCILLSCLNTNNGS